MRADAAVNDMIMTVFGYMLFIATRLSATADVAVAMLLFFTLFATMILLAAHICALYVDACHMPCASAAAADCRCRC